MFCVEVMGIDFTWERVDDRLKGTLWMCCILWSSPNSPCSVTVQHTANTSVTSPYWLAMVVICAVIGCAVLSVDV